MVNSSCLCRLGLLALLLVMAGCSRTHYRLRADTDSYDILAEKAGCRPWTPPPGFTVYPDPHSRFFDPTPLDDPTLPIPSPPLYAYGMPELPQRDPNRFRGQGPGSADEMLGEGVELALSDIDATPFPPVSLTAFAPAAAERVPLPDEAIDELLGSQGELDDEELAIVPIPETIWSSLPESCRTRMFEFGTVREEYRRSFGGEPPEELRDRSQRLALEDIVELALVNSREYQAQKERLYLAALNLTLDRFDYQLKFATSGNGTDVNYGHLRSRGETVNTLGIPSSLRVDKLLCTGGAFVESFANEVLLTFNGSDGFDADVRSDFVIRFTQTIFQRDAVLEGLTQAERDVVYAARSFARFRKSFFRDLANQYYSLLLTYRTIEINTQDFFSLVRGFLQGEAEYRAGRLPRFQVDQFEQNALVSRGALISICNSLENSLDLLKFEIGLPPELPLNLDLTELDVLTQRDGVAAAAERVRRARRTLMAERRQENPQRSLLLNNAIDLLGRMLTLAERDETPAGGSSLAQPVEMPLRKLLVEQAELEADANRQLLEDELVAALPLTRFQRLMDVVDSLLAMSARELQYAESRGVDRDQLQSRLDDGLRVRREYESLRKELEQTVTNREVAKIPELIRSAEALLATVENFAARIDPLLPPRDADPQRQLAATLRDIDQLLEQSEQVLAALESSLVPVEIEMDEAMLTALTLRFDLMNERESLADDWRRVKLRADDLKSVLDLDANTQIRTRSGFDRPFDFTWDDSTTRVSARFDAPLNRRSQRNNFRRSLIDYNAGLRGLIEAEDSIKRSVRVTLRELQLQRELYENAVANAALAYERLISTQIQLQKGLEDVTARDVLESQTAYTESLNAVASRHISYIRQRIQLFLDLELLEVDLCGFWPQLYDESFQPEPNLSLPPWACPVYGELPSRTWHTHRMRRMLQVPPGPSRVYSADGSGDGDEGESPREIQIPEDPQRLSPAAPEPASDAADSAGIAVPAIPVEPPPAPPPGDG